MATPNIRVKTYHLAHFLCLPCNPPGTFCISAISGLRFTLLTRHHLQDSRGPGPTRPSVCPGYSPSWPLCGIDGVSGWSASAGQVRWIPCSCWTVSHPNKWSPRTWLIGQVNGHTKSSTLDKMHLFLKTSKSNRTTIAQPSVCCLSPTNTTVLATSLLPSKQLPIAPPHLTTALKPEKNIKVKNWVFLVKPPGVGPRLASCRWEVDTHLPPKRNVENAPAQIPWA